MSQRPSHGLTQRQRAALGSPAVIAFWTRSISLPLSLSNTATRLFDVMSVGAELHGEAPAPRTTVTVSMAPIAASRSFADGNRYTFNSAAPSAYVVPGTSNTPVGAAPFRIGTNPASVSRFSTLHACHAPSETQVAAAGAPAELGDGAAVAGESARADAAGGGVAAEVDAESPPDPPSRAHAATATKAAASAAASLTRTPIRNPRWRPTRTAE